jgi:hypothetical protein
MQVNALRAHLAEFGLLAARYRTTRYLSAVAAQGHRKLPDLIKIVSEAAGEWLPDIVRKTLFGLLDAIALLNAQVAAIEKRPVAGPARTASASRSFRASG